MKNVVAWTSCTTAGLVLGAWLVPGPHAGNAAAASPASSPGKLQSPNVCLPWWGFLQFDNPCPCSVNLGGDGQNYTTFFTGNSLPGCDGCTGALDLVWNCPTYIITSTIYHSGPCSSGTNRIRQYCPSNPAVHIAVAEVVCLDCNEPLPE